jgi:hypothetical protein
MLIMVLKCSPMSQPHPKNNGNKPLRLGDLARAALGISAPYAAGSSQTIKIELEQTMNNPFQITLSKRPLMPSLFQVAARADEVPTERASKKSPSGHARLSELMLNPRKLEAVLNAIGKKKKSAAR